MSEVRRYFGKYRGKVIRNVDPQLRGRIEVEVPDVFGSNKKSWALPCVPYAGRGVGLFLVPPERALVWVEFEQGDPDHPIWTGCFWEKDEAPASPATAEKKVLKTDTATITIDDQQGSITIEIKSGMKIDMTKQGIEITNGKGASLKLSDKKVSINDTALEVE